MFKNRAVEIRTKARKIQHPCISRADVCLPGAEIPIPDGFLCRVHRQAEQLLARTKAFPEMVALGNVAQESKGSSPGPRVVGDRHLNRPKFPGFGAVRGFEQGIAVLANVRVPTLGTFLVVLGIKVRHPHLQQFIGTVARTTGINLIHVDQLQLVVHDPETVARTLHRRPKLDFGLAISALQGIALDQRGRMGRQQIKDFEGFFIVMPRGSIVRREHPQELPPLAAERCGLDGNDAQPAHALKGHRLFGNQAMLHILDNHPLAGDEGGATHTMIVGGVIPVVDPPSREISLGDDL